MKDAQEYKGRIDFGILMARQDELEAALDNRFEILDNARGLRTHVITRVATRDGGEYLLSLTRCSDQGHGPAYEVADAIITDLDPQWLIVVGIGGAVPADEFSLGDVLVANVVPDFSLQAANEGKPPTFDLRGGEVHPKVLDLVAHLPTMRNALAGWNTKQSIRVPLPRLDLPRLNSDALYGPEDWQKKVVASLTRNFPPTRKQPRPRRYWTGPIGTSNTLVKDTEFVNALLAGARGAVAVEMETGGARRAARRTDRDYPVLTIRGVSDVIGFKRNPDWTSFACHSAASFLYALIKARPIEPRSQSQSAKPSGSGAPGALKHDGSDSSPKQPGHYWGTAPSSVTLHGRDLEFRTLAEHCRRKSCRIIGLFGKGGIGKTALATAVIRAVADDFDFLYWHDLRNAPPIEEVLRHCLYVLSNFQSKTQPADTENLILDLIAHMRQHRTLLVLDNFETMMEPGKPSYRPGYAEYGSFIRKLGETDHSGCVVLTSREKPPEWTLIEDNNHTVVGHLVRRLDNSAGAKLLKQRPLVGPNSLLHAVVRLYSGNPAALKHVSEQIQTVYLGDVNAFLKSGQRLPTSVNAILCEQVSRLSSVEREILNWLAIAREAMTVDSLHDDLLTQESKESLANGLSILLDRDLVLRSEVGFTLENLVLEYLTDRLVEEFSADIISGSSITLLNSHAMLVASSKEHVRASQSRLLLRPVSDRVVSNHGGNSEAARYLWALLARLRVERGRRPGYATGNLINLLCELGADFTGSDLSELTIWQAYLREVALKNVSFRNAEFAKCAFVETFSGILSVAVSSDGTLLATGDAHGEVLVWRANEDQALFRRRAHDNWVRCVAFSPDGRFLATGSDDQTVMIFRVHLGECLFTLRGHANRVRSIAWSHDGRFLASAGDDNAIRLWLAESGELIASLEGHRGHVRSVAFLPDGKHLVSGGEDSVLKLWDVTTGRCERTFEGHNQPVCAVAVSPDGRVIGSGGDDQIVRLWGVDGAPRGLLSGHTAWVWSVAFSRDGKTLASGGGDRSARLWDLKTLQCLRSFEGHAHWVRSVAFSGDDRMLVTGGDDRTIRMWDLSSGQCTKVLRGHSNPIWAVAFSPDNGILASSGNDESIKLWDLATGSVVKVLGGHESWVWAVGFSPDGHRLGSASGDMTARIWDLTNRHAPMVLRGHDSQVRTVAFDPSGRFVVTGSDDKTARLWELATGQCLRVLQGHESQVWALAISPDGSLLATGSDDQTIRIWDLAAGECAAILRGHTNRVLAVAFSGDGLWLASGSEDRTIRLWRAPFSESRVLSGHSNWVQSVTFCRANEMLASGSDDQTVILWDVVSGERVDVLREHSDWVRTVAATNDGTMFASGSQDGTIKIWDAQKLTCLRTLRVGRLYEGMDISGVRGLTPAQIDSLVALGAEVSGKVTGDLT